MNNVFTRYLWSIIYKKWLWCSYTKKYYKVIKVKGWRTAIIDNGCSRKSRTPIFWWFK